ncbi:MAG: metalloregulator ArsR/SmtB family transcription factor [Thermoplasmata archaeon]
MKMPADVAEGLERIGGEEGLKKMIPNPLFMTMASSLFKALSDPVRVEILYLTSIHPLVVTTIRNITGVGDSKLSYHLSIMNRAGLISRRTESNWIIYSISHKGRRFLELLRSEEMQKSLLEWRMEYSSK